jgi:hypothetical protein
MSPRTSLQTLESLAAHLADRKRELGRWQAVADEIGVSVGTCVRVANGYEPKRPELRRRLGLPIMAAVPCCYDCGGIHISKRCPVRPVSPYSDAATWLQERYRPPVKTGAVYGAGGKSADW